MSIYDRGSSTGAAAGDPVTAKRAAAIRQLGRHAAAIRQLGKRVVADVVEIGRRLSECKRICGHGNWLPWLNREFGWEETTAQRFMRVHALAQSKSGTLPDLPVSAIYLLAAPSTPEAARTEIIERAKTGAPVSVAEVKQTIDTAKRTADAKAGLNFSASSGETPAPPTAASTAVTATESAPNNSVASSAASAPAGAATSAETSTAATGNGAATAALTRRERREIMRGEFNRVGRLLVEVNPDVACEVRTLIWNYYDHADDLVGAIDRAMGIEEDSDADAAHASADMPPREARR